MNKPRFAFLELSGCGDCLVDMYMEKNMYELIEEGEIIYWPPIGISKDIGDVDNVDVLFVSGAVRTRNDEEKLLKLADKSRIIVAYGTCSIYGGLTGMTALQDPGELGDTELLYPTVKPIVDFIEPHIYAPGCPPTRDTVSKLVDTLREYLSNGKEPKRVFLIPRETLCRHCPRRPRNPEKAEMPGIKDPYSVVDDGRCFIEQGILCMGPVTANGCGHLCIRFNQPCSGCMGPARGVVDQGLNMIGAIGSILLKNKETKLLFPGLARELDKFKDPFGYFYRYTLPKAMLTKIALKRRGVD